MTIPIPPEPFNAVGENDVSERFEWLAAIDPDDATGEPGRA